MTDKIQKIREGIEKLKSNLIYGACSSQVAMETRCKEEAYNEVLAILDTMQEEPVSEELNNAAVEWFNSVKYKNDLSGTPIEGFKAGAKWQKEQMLKESKLAEKKDDDMLTIAYMDGVEEGKKIMQEEMMKEAIEGVAYPDDEQIWCDLDRCSLENGEKVKFIITK